MHHICLRFPVLEDSQFAKDTKEPKANSHWEKVIIQG